MIQFKKIVLHNFGSYEHAELDLQNRGFCLVSGKNNCSKDNALSNGSGKSQIFSAICFALTGETINGLKTNLKNINTKERDCWVQLEFLYNKDLYNVCRIVAPKTDLKIVRNDTDLSGKGIRESEKKLQELLPDLSKDFIASTTILGQGMPNKFSSFSPSGRKELLEKLTKSDFMIDDIKARILARQQELSSKVREFEDSLLTNKTQLNSYINQLEKLKLSSESGKMPDFDSLINDQQIIIIRLEAASVTFTNKIELAESQLTGLNSKMLEITAEKTKVSNEELAAYNSAFTDLKTKKVKLEVEISNLNREIKKLKAITDTCPTCGQHLPNVHKPDTSALEATVQANKFELNSIDDNIRKCVAQHKEYQMQIDNAFNDELANVNNNISAARNAIQENKVKQQINNAELDKERATLNKLIYDQQNYASSLKRQQEEISNLESEIAKLNNLISITIAAKGDFDQRLAVVKKMDQLTKRNFRGYLLYNIISYIDQKAKKYCETVFGTRELSLEISGNALDITYCNKAFDSLSGGEKQRVDLILQFAIRDLLNSYLGISANILVLDEITDFLDKKSCRAVMSLLEKELNTVESVFIISHRAATLDIPIDFEVKVTKDEHGISTLE